MTERQLPHYTIELEPKKIETKDYQESAPVDDELADRKSVV